MRCFVGSALFQLVAAMSTGGGSNGQGQTCDALNLCPSQCVHWAGDPRQCFFAARCPTGMHKVGGPSTTVLDPVLGRESPRNPLYTIRTGNGADPASDPTSYKPTELLHIHIRVTKKMVWKRSAHTNGVAGMHTCYPGTTSPDHFPYICGESPGAAAPPPYRGTVTSAAERLPTPYAAHMSGTEIPVYTTAKYLGLLLYAVDENETKVGSWEIPNESPLRFWTPPDPGCDGRAVMHTDATEKSNHHVFSFRTPAAGKGALTFRALIKQGYTNGGAFYWPLAPAMPNAKDDLVVSETLGATNLTARWVAGKVPGQSCDEVCAAAGGRACDSGAMRAPASAEAFAAAIVDDVTCKSPVLSGCGASAPGFNAAGDGYCWHGACGATGAPLSTCGATNPNVRRICACGAAAGAPRRRLGERSSLPVRARASANGAARRGRGAATLVAAASAGLLGVLAPSLPPSARAALALLGAAAFLPSARAHNWVMKPASRARLASTPKPCRARIAAEPHVQLNPGDEFPVEWRVGHPTYARTYWTLVRAEDEWRLMDLSDAVWKEYLDGAPRASDGSVSCNGTDAQKNKETRATTCAQCQRDEATVSRDQCANECTVSASGECVLDPSGEYRFENPLPPEGNFYDGEKYNKYHVGGRIDANGERNCAGSMGYDEAENIAFRGPKVEPADPLYIRRPLPYACDDGARNSARDRRGPSVGRDCRNCNMQQFSCVLSPYVPSTR